MLVDMCSWLTQIVLAKNNFNLHLEQRKVLEKEEGKKKVLFT